MRVGRRTHRTAATGRRNLRSELTDAFRLVQESEAGTNQADFQREFHSYWSRQASLSAKPVFSLLEARGPSRLIRLWHGKDWCVVGETEEQIATWLKHRHGNKPNTSTVTSLACFGFRSSSTHGISTFRRGPLRLGWSTKKVFAAPQACASGRYSFSHSPWRRYGQWAVFRDRTLLPSEAHRSAWQEDAEVRPGFRPGKVPPALQTQHVFSGLCRGRTEEVDRVDAAWVHGRGMIQGNRALAEKHVVIAGCGSVGAPLAQQLAMAGVGRLTLVDPELFLGPISAGIRLARNSIGRSRKPRPWRNSCRRTYLTFRSTAFVGTLDEFLRKRSWSPATDLLISATADWTSERVLNLDHIDGTITCPLLLPGPNRMPALVMPFTCPWSALPSVRLYSRRRHAQAGDEMAGEHAESSFGTRMRSTFPALRPYRTDGNRFCSGSLDIGCIARQDSITATHRVWAGPSSLLEEAGGAWTDAWLAQHPDRNEGAFQETIIWQEDLNCSACGHRHRQALVSTSASPDRNS